MKVSFNIFKSVDCVNVKVFRCSLVLPKASRHVKLSVQSCYQTAPTQLAQHPSALFGTEMLVEVLPLAKENFGPELIFQPFILR